MRLRMNLDDVRKLLEFKDFKDVKKCLSEHNVPVIPYYVDDRKDYNFEKKFDLIAKGIFEISDKNKIHNIKIFINNFEAKEPKKDVNFCSNRLYINDYDSAPSIIINYINNFKFDEIMEPLSSLFSDRPSHESMKFTKASNYSLNIYQFWCDGNVSEILEPCVSLQNPIYGLLHYKFFNSYTFNFKSFNLNSCYTYKLEDNYTSSYKRFFKRLEMPNYEYELINDERNQDMFYLKFYRTEDNTNVEINRKPLISLYLKNTFYENFRIKRKTLEKLLDIISETERYITVRHYSDEILTFKIGESKYQIENYHNVFLEDIFEDLALEQKHLVKRVYYFFRELFVNYTKDGVITTNNYYDGYHSNNRSMISSKFRSNLLS